MENIGENKILHYLDRIQKDRSPITADIFLNNYCNNKCPFCTYRRWELEKGARAMSFDDFKKYAVRLVKMGVQGFILTGGGEPTIAPDFLQICRWLEDNGLHYGVNTNFNVYREIAPDYLKISLDAWDEESYKRFRGVAAYNIVRENIKQYLKWKKAHNIQTNVGLQKIGGNADEIAKFYEANMDLDVDYIVFRPMESTCGSYYQSADKKAEAQEAMKIIAILAEQDKRVQLNFKWHLLNQRENKCTAQWAQIAINELGQVMYCCHKPYEIVGHVMDADILIKKAQAQTNMALCDVPCRMTSPNMTVAQIEKIKTANFI